MVQNQDVVGWGLGVTGVALLVYVGWIAITKLDPHARDRIFAAVILMIGSLLFWALFEQAGSSLNLYTDRYVDRMLFGWEVPASMFQSINALYINLLAPLFARLLTPLGRRSLELSAPSQFVRGHHPRAGGRRGPGAGGSD